MSPNYTLRHNTKGKTTMKTYIYKTLKDFAMDYAKRYNSRPTNWQCFCYMTGYNPYETLKNVFDVIKVLIDEDLVDCSKSIY